MNQIIQINTGGQWLKSNLRLSVFGLFLALIGQLLVVGCGGSDDDGDSVAPQTPGNAAPIITSATATSPDLLVNESTDLVVVAVDEDDIDLTYTWVLASEGDVELTNANAATATATFSAIGDYIFSVSVTDGTSTDSETVTVSVTATGPGENSPPTITSPVASPSAVFVGGTVELKVVATDTDNDTLTYSWTESTGVVNLTNDNTDTATADFTGVPADNYTFKVSVTDSKSDPVTAEVIVHVSVDTGENVAPSITELNGPTDSIIVGTTLLSVVANDRNINDQLSYSWTVVEGDFVSFSAQTSDSTEVTFSAAGTYVVTVTVTDDADVPLNDIRTITIEVVDPVGENQAPVIDSLSTSSKTVTIFTADENDTADEFVTLTVDASDDKDVSGLSYVWTSSSADVVFTAPTAATTEARFPSGGTSNLTVTVTDEDGAYVSKGILVRAVEEFDVWITSPGNDDELTYAPTVPVTAIVHNPMMYEFGRVTLYLGSRALGNAIDFIAGVRDEYIFDVPHTLLPVRDEAYTLVAVATTGTDADGNALHPAQPHTITVTVVHAEEPMAPVITEVFGGGNYVADAGTGSVEVELSVAAMDPNGDALTYAWEAAASVTFDDLTAQTQTVTLTPGYYAFTVTATDAGALTAERTFGVNVQDPATPNTLPVVNSLTAHQVSAKVGYSVKLSADAEDADGDVLTYEWDKEGSGNVDFTPLNDSGSEVLATFHEMRTKPDGSPAPFYFLNCSVSDGFGVALPQPNLVVTVEAAPTELSVWFTSPKKLSEVQIPGSITVTAAAYAPNGVDQILFYDNATPPNLVGESTGNTAEITVNSDAFGTPNDDGQAIAIRATVVSTDENGDRVTFKPWATLWVKPLAVALEGE